MLHDQSPFSLGVYKVYIYAVYKLYPHLDFKSDLVWYLNKALGKNSIGDFFIEIQQNSSPKK